MDTRAWAFPSGNVIVGHKIDGCQGIGDLAAPWLCGAMAVRLGARALRRCRPWARRLRSGEGAEWAALASEWTRDPRSAE